MSSKKEFRNFDLGSFSPPNTIPLTSHLFSL
uniref:Uncharacterized protein n=1 Tax=Rhizophora mucronata TaxID=61149 RepID=A0A2P2NAH6_RHIMU